MCGWWCLTRRCGRHVDIGALGPSPPRDQRRWCRSNDDGGAAGVSQRRWIPRGAHLHPERQCHRRHTQCDRRSRGESDAATAIGETFGFEPSIHVITSTKLEDVISPNPYLEAGNAAPTSVHYFFVHQARLTTTSRASPNSPRRARSSRSAGAWCTSWRRTVSDDRSSPQSSPNSSAATSPSATIARSPDRGTSPIARSLSPSSRYRDTRSNDLTPESALLVVAPRAKDLHHVGVSAF